MVNPYEIIDARLRNIEHFLLDIKEHLGSPSHSCAQKKRKLNIREISEYTGIPVNTLYGMSSRGELPFLKKVGKKLSADQSAIDAFYDTKGKRTPAQIKESADNLSVKTKTSSK